MGNVHYNLYRKHSFTSTPYTIHCLYHWSAPCEKHVKSMWKGEKFICFFHMNMCENMGWHENAMWNKKSIACLWAKWHIVKKYVKSPLDLINCEKVREISISYTFSKCVYLHTSWSWSHLVPFFMQSHGRLQAKIN